MESGICKHCNTVFSFYKGRNSAGFCSKDCSYGAREKSTHSKECLSCGSTFVCKGLKSDRKYCSNICVGAANTGRKMSEGSKLKKEKTFMRKYGVNNPAKSPVFKEKIKNTCLEKYGDTSATRSEMVKNKVKETCLERYGHSCPLAASAIKEKSRDTMLSKYGVDSPMKCRVVKDKAKATCLEKYGYENPSSSAEVREKVKNTFLGRYGVDSYLKTEKMKEGIRRRFNGKWVSQAHLPQEIFNLLKRPELVINMNKGGMSLTSIAEKIGCTPLWLSRLFAKHGIEVKSFSKSNPELGVSSLLEELGVSFKMNDRVFKFELDFLCQNNGLAIEVDGLYWHSERTKDNNYHLNKTEVCLREGIKLLHFWDSEWNLKRNICKSIIKNSLGLTSNRIFARKCEIKEVSHKDSSIFLEDNHLQGAATASVRIGLYYKDELVSLMTFSKPRYSKNESWELVRFVNRLDTQVVGAASRLLSHFRKTYRGDIISYADRRISTGNLYEKLGFSLLRISPPNYFYTKDHKTLYSRVKFQKHKLPKLLDNFNSDLSEAENMKNNGYHRVYDCGNLVYLLK